MSVKAEIDIINIIDNLKRSKQLEIINFLFDVLDWGDIASLADEYLDEGDIDCLIEELQKLQRLR